MDNILNEHDYRLALKQCEALMDMHPEIGAKEGNELDKLASLIEAYESKTYPINPPSLEELIKFRIDQQRVY